MNPDIYPLTVTKDRYYGTYSGAYWTAWNCAPYMIPEAPFSDDVSCYEFWSNTTMTVGKGDTPEAAIRDLANKLYS
jgi:hypothetical protein